VKRAALVLLAVAVAGCESTQDKSARLERAAQSAKQETGLVVAKAARDVQIAGTTVLQDPNGAAVVVELRNRSRNALVGLPLAMSVLDGQGNSLYANDAPGLDASLVTVASLAGNATLAWVNDQVTIASTDGKVEAKVGEPPKPGPTELPDMAVSGLKVEGDASGDVAVVGQVANRSQIEQRRLVVHVVGRKGGRIVAAARAIVERLAPGKSATFNAFPIGDPRGAELSAAAPPTVVAP
jgi:hypothetical protein